MSSAKNRNPNKRYAYHNDFGHLTEDCISLKKAIQLLIDPGPCMNIRHEEATKRKGSKIELRIRKIGEQMTGALNIESITSLAQNIPAQESDQQPRKGYADAILPT